MPAPARSAGGYRIYGPDHLKRLSFVRRGRELGCSLEELRGLLRLVDGHAYTCAEVQTLTVKHLAVVRRKIADLRRLQRVMAEIAAQCTGNRVPDCPIIDALFDARPLSLSGGGVAVKPTTAVMQLRRAAMYGRCTGHDNQRASIRELDGISNQPPPRATTAIL